MSLRTVSIRLASAYICGGVTLASSLVRAASLSNWLATPVRLRAMFFNRKALSAETPDD